MRVVETKIYKFEELSDAAKERAREWWRKCENEDSSHEYQFDDFERMGKILGIEIDQRPIKLHGGGTRYEPTIYYSGFWSQGDGACFEGSYSYAKRCARNIRKEAPQDETLHRIADELVALQRPRFYGLQARVKHRGHYYHEGCTVIDVENPDHPEACSFEDEKALAETLRSFMRWIYKSLEAEYEWKMADAQVDENIIANEYEFDENGEIH